MVKKQADAVMRLWTMLELRFMCVKDWQQTMGYEVETQVLRVDCEHPEPEIIEVAAKVIQRGGLVAFPTETVYGLGANALDAEAIDRIYAAKRRPANDPLIVHIHSADQLDQLAVDIPDVARELAARFWAGALTMVFKRAAHVPANIAHHLQTIAIRMPVHPVARALIAASGVPIAAPSANTFTRPSATTSAHVLEDLNGRVDLVLDGGAAPIGIESTVLDMTQAVPVVLRPGGVLLDDLRQVVPQIVIAEKYLSGNDTEMAASPGMHIKHYSPRANVMLFDGPLNVVHVAICDTAQRLVANGKRVGILTTDEEAANFTDLGVRIISLGATDDLTQIGRVLFGAMRALDAQGVDAILVRRFAQAGLGIAIGDRLLRAAEGRVIRVQ